LDTTIKIDKKIKEKLERLNFVKKNDTYNDIISRLIENHEKINEVRGWKR